MIKLNQSQIMFILFGAILGALVDGFSTIIIGVLLGIVLGRFIR